MTANTIAERAAAHPAVAEAVTSVLPSGHVALFCAAREEISPRRLREHLGSGEEPDEVYVMVELPRVDDDLDWESLVLLAEDDAPRRADYVAPEAGTEAYLAGVWEDLLQMDRVGAQDDFFAAGGHSMLAVRVRQAIERDQHVTVPAEVLFTNSILAEQARAIEEARS